VLDNPAVGGHLQDHLAVVYSYKATQPTLNDELHSTFGKLRAGLRYFASKSGPLALSVNQFGGFLRADSYGAAPGCSVVFQSGDLRRRRCSPHTHRGRFVLRILSMLSADTATSTGRIDIASPDYRRAPTIAPNYLATDKDLQDVGPWGRLVQAMREPGMRALIRESIAPTRIHGAAELLADFRAPRRHRVPPDRNLPHGRGSWRIRWWIQRCACTGSSACAVVGRIGVSDDFSFRQYQCADAMVGAKGGRI